MFSHLKGVVVLFAMSGIILAGSPAFAAEPDVDSPAGPELPAPRMDRPDFQQDDQAGAVIDPQTEGADPSPPIMEEAPDEVIVDPGRSSGD
jgi:hypothetical protein